jgi:hypothetical protein
MFLLLAAPLFSQSLGASAAPAWMSEMACGDGGGHAPAGQDQALWAQCGYCTLLLSSPALPGVMAAQGMAAQLPATLLPVPAGRTEGGRIPAHDAPPRAPPRPV